MNHPFVVSQAKALLAAARIARLRQRCGARPRPDAQLFQRAPTNDELAAPRSTLCRMRKRRPSRVRPPPTPGNMATANGTRSRRREDLHPLPLLHRQCVAEAAADWPNQSLAGRNSPRTADIRATTQARRRAALGGAADGGYDVRSTLCTSRKRAMASAPSSATAASAACAPLKLHQSSARSGLSTPLHLSAGDTLDFIVDIGDALNSDQFLWAPASRGRHHRRGGGDSARSVGCLEGFRRPAALPLNAVGAACAGADAHERIRVCGIDPTMNLPLTRRDFLRRSGMGLGMLGLADYSHASRRRSRPAARTSRRRPSASSTSSSTAGRRTSTRSIRSRLLKYAGKPLPQTLLTERKTGAAFPSPFKFQKYGQSGIEVSELFAQDGAAHRRHRASSARCTPRCPITSRR